LKDFTEDQQQQSTALLSRIRDELGKWLQVRGKAKRERGIADSSSDEQDETNLPPHLRAIKLQQRIAEEQKQNNDRLLETERAQREAEIKESRDHKDAQFERLIAAVESPAIKQMKDALDALVGLEAHLPIPDVEKMRQDILAHWMPIVAKQYN
jgi:hypothetical protein